MFLRSGLVIYSIISIFSSVLFYAAIYLAAMNMLSHGKFPQYSSPAIVIAMLLLPLAGSGVYFVGAIVFRIMIFRILNNPAAGSGRLLVLFASGFLWVAVLGFSILHILFLDAENRAEMQIRAATHSALAGVLGIFQTFCNLKFVSGNPPGSASN